MNAAGYPLLSLLTFLPLVGAFIIMMVFGTKKLKGFGEDLGGGYSRFQKSHE